MEATIYVFSNPQFGEIRTVKDENGEPLFCLTDLCKSLGLNNDSTNKVAKRLDPDDRYSVPVIDKMGRKQLATFVNEPGMYTVILRSDSPLAKPVQKWVVSEVLPSIRKTGGYIMSTPEDTPEMIMARALIVAQETINRVNAQLKEKEKKIEIQEATIKSHLPKLNYYDQVLTSTSSHTATTIANQFSMSAITLNQMLVKAKVLRKTGKEYSLASKYQGNGYTDSETFSFNRTDGTSGSKIELRWTEKGREFVSGLIPRAINAGALILRKGRYYINHDWKPSN